MQPENQQPIPPQPIQPQPVPVVPAFQSTQPPIQPAPVVATTFPQPAASTQAMTGMKPPTTANLEKQKKVALILAIISIIIFIVGLILGYSWAYAGILGVYALVIGIRARAIPTIILGGIGAVLNIGLYILALIVNG